MHWLLYEIAYIFIYVNVKIYIGIDNIYYFLLEI